MHSGVMPRNAAKFLLSETFDGLHFKKAIRRHSHQTIVRQFLMRRLESQCTVMDCAADGLPFNSPASNAAFELPPLVLVKCPQR